nr:hypothetical protein [Tanacetum cinerariifolium]
MSQEFLDHPKDHGIIAHRTPRYTPQHNGVSEKRNRTLLDMVRFMMSQTTLPKSFWDYALETDARILNMVSTKKVEKTPYEVWHGQALKLSYLKVRGCEVLVKRDTLTKPDKLEPRSINCIFIGHPKETMGYSFYYPPENKVLVARNAEFLEDDLEIIQEEDTHPSIDTSLNHEEDDLEINEPQRDLGELANYKAALLDTESKKWLNAMNLEMQSMKDNKVWVLVELSPNGITVGNIRAIKILIAIAAYYDYEIWQMDVKTAFFNGYLNENVYMEQPEDDILIMGNNVSMLQSVKSYLGRCFAMKDLGEAAYILGIKIYRDRSRRLIGLCQSAYIEKILKRYCMENSKRGSIPMQEKLKLSKSQGASTPAELKRVQNVPYSSAVGSIMCAVRCTRPDVAFAQNVTSRFQQNPGDIHWNIVKNILTYLINTKDMFLVYGGDLKRELRVFCYTDVGYLMDADDLKSQTGYVFILNSGVVDWKSAKKFISGLGVVPTIEEPIRMYCDNIGAITIANESGITKGARHFRAKVHYLREVIEYGDGVETNANLKRVAMKVVEECVGLSLFLKAVGNALKTKSIKNWERALTRLQEDAPSSIDPEITQAFTRLKLSYDFLENEAQSCFLLRFSMPQNHGGARQRVEDAVKILTSFGLLLKLKDKRYTKMQDVVRDVALLIASKGENNFLVEAGKGLTEWLPRNNELESYTGISLTENAITKLPDYELHLPHLEVFLRLYLSMNTSNRLDEIKKKMK